jgi:hypothetical protein
LSAAEAPAAIPETCAGPRIRLGGATVDPVMLGTWNHDIESLEAISQDDDTKRIFLRMALLGHHGQIGSFLHELQSDHEIDDATKGTLTELAQDRAFLLAVEDYLVRTERIH